MYISNYQIHNVLKVYTSHLSKSRSSGRHQTAENKPVLDSISISHEGRRQSVINKVAEEIVARITLNDDRAQTEEKSFIDQLRENLDRQIDSENGDRESFVYNVIGANEEKMTNVLSTEDATLLMKRLEQLAQGKRLGNPEPSAD